MIFEKYALLKELEESTKPIADKEWLISIIEKPHNLKILRQSIMKNYELANHSKVAYFCTSLRNKLDHHLSQKTREEHEKFLTALDDMTIFKNNPEKIEIAILSIEHEWLLLQKKILEIKKYANIDRLKTESLYHEIIKIIDDSNFDTLHCENILHEVHTFVSEK
jgi:hypothetical protein